MLSNRIEVFVLLGDVKLQPTVKTQSGPCTHTIGQLYSTSWRKLTSLQTTQNRHQSKIYSLGLLTAWEAQKALSYQETDSGMMGGRLRLSHGIEFARQRRPESGWRCNQKSGFLDKCACLFIVAVRICSYIYCVVLCAE